MASKIARPATAFQMSSGRKRPRIEAAGHLAFVRSLPCIICAAPPQSDPCHIRYGSLPHGKAPSGAGEKPSDKWTLPMCRGHHDAQHAAGNESRWWSGYAIDPLCVAALLYCASGDEEAGGQIIAGARRLILWR